MKIITLTPSSTPAVSQRWLCYDVLLKMIRVFLVSIICTAISACSKSNNETENLVEDKQHMDLGVSEEMMISKMLKLEAVDITKEVEYDFTHSISSPQRYYWWKLPDDTISAVLVSGEARDSMTVSVIEISKTGIGKAGMKNWRSNIDYRASSLDNPRKQKMQNKTQQSNR